MSGLAAIYGPDLPAEAIQARLDAYSDRMARRARHGKGRHVQYGVGLLHLRFDDRGTFVDGAGPWRLRSDGPVLTGDLFLTNVESLCAQVGVANPSQAAAVLAAYDRWGLDAFSRLEGEFAFVLWDPMEQRLCAVRDRFGIRPLAYRRNHGELCIASDAQALAEDTDRPSPIWIANFLSGQETDATLTPFQGVCRLAPSHMLIQTKESFSIRRWWSLEPEELPPSQAAATLKERLQTAVADRLPPGAATFLSGGLDSSSLTCLAARVGTLPVKAYSMRYPEMASLDEGKYIEAVRRLPNIDGRDILPENGRALHDPSGGLAEQGQPTHAMNMATMRQALAKISKDDVRVIIDGHGGDEVAGTGLWHMATLAQGGRWLELLRMVHAHARFSGSTDIAGTMGQFMSASSNRFMRKAARLLPRAAPDDPFAWRDLVDDGLAGSTDLVSRVRHMTQTAHADLPPHMRLHASMIVNPATASGFEALDRAAISAGLMQRFPFYDHRVAAICLGQPDAQKIAEGRPRSLLRRAMQGVLPEEVRLRSDKVDFFDEIRIALSRDISNRLVQYRQAMPERLRGYVDPATLEKASRMLMEDDRTLQGYGLTRIWRVFWLDQWLMSRDRAYMDETLVS